VILSGVGIDVVDPIGDVGLNLETLYVLGPGIPATDSRPDISAYTSCLILPGHDLKPS
jgi:hypothetical protein